MMNYRGMRPEPQRPTPIVCSPHVICNRGSGLSTVQALAVLANAVANPGVPQIVVDHFPTLEASRELCRVIQRMREALGLDVIFNVERCLVTAVKHGIQEEPKYVRR